MIEFETIDEFINEFYIDCKCLIDGDKTKITKDIITSALRGYAFYDRDYTVRYRTLTLHNVIEKVYTDPKTTFDISINKIRRVYWDGAGGYVAILMKDNTIYDVDFGTREGIDYTSVDKTSVDDKIAWVEDIDIEFALEKHIMDEYGVDINELF